ncbi:Hypothetical predicted protein [Olea europaea subsp. europaea]|uniref:Uncharacterized protein n=1 Tax=Olea europaea subsp. europaea TaxID=158383 RepID=A0A8S0TM09_OLEEU|nr:Hypothetical predicted protein [Olea europaea subsp. europaea]
MARPDRSRPSWVRARCDNCCAAGNAHGQHARETCEIERELRSRARLINAERARCTPQRRRRPPVDRAPVSNLRRVSSSCPAGCARTRVSGPLSVALSLAVGSGPTGRSIARAGGTRVPEVREIPARAPLPPQDAQQRPAGSGRSSQTLAGRTFTFAIERASERPKVHMRPADAPSTGRRVRLHFRRELPFRRLRRQRRRPDNFTENDRTDLERSGGP